MLLLRPFDDGIVVWSMLVSPELTFGEDSSILLDYWLWFNVSQPHTPVSFMLFRSARVRSGQPASGQVSRGQVRSAGVRSGQPGSGQVRLGRVR